MVISIINVLVEFDYPAFLDSRIRRPKGSQHSTYEICSSVLCLTGTLLTGIISQSEHITCEDEPISH